jgi:hypothetical protein
MKRKIYEPVREFERATSYCPLYLAWRIVDEARDYFRTPIPEAFADKLARRAEAVFARHPFWSRKASNFAEASMDRSPRGGRRQFQSQRQREFILMFMRHWLAGVLAKERPALFRDLPESFKVGHPLPDHSLTRLRHPLPSNGRRIKTGGAAAPPYHKPKTVGLTCRPASKSGISRPASRFVHGCELLPV